MFFAPILDQLGRQQVTDLLMLAVVVIPIPILLMYWGGRHGFLPLAKVCVVIVGILLFTMFVLLDYLGKTT